MDGEAGEITDWASVPQAAMTSSGKALVMVSFQVADYEQLRKASASVALPGPDAAEGARREAARTISRADAALAEAVSAGADVVLEDLDVGTYAVTRRYGVVPAVALEVDDAAFERLLKNPRVTAVRPNLPTRLPVYAIESEFDRQTGATANGEEPDPVLMDDVVDIIGATGAWTKGYDGEGWYVAILDTGIRRTHEFFTGKTIVEACFSALNHCPNGSSSMYGAGAAAHYDSAYEGYDHGTHVSGIAAGHRSNDSLNGVAKSADIIAVNVFSRFTAAQCGSSSPCVMSYDSDQVAGMEYVYSLRGTHNIGAVNMSLGGGEYSSYCDSANPSETAAIEDLASVNIATAIAAGNEYYCGAVGSPGCISAAVTVSAVNKSDEEASFNNWHETITDLWAPGVSIYSSTGTSDSSYGSWSGTSMATPAVTGAFTLQRQFSSSDAVDVLLARLGALGPAVGTNKCSGTGTKPRLYVDNFDAVTGLRAYIEPAAATTAGAQWRIDGGAWRDSGEIVEVDAGQHVLSFGSVSGWTAPASRTVTALADQIVSTTVTYEADTSQLGEALDNTALTWSVGGDAVWFSQSNEWRYDGDAAQNDDIGDSESAWFETTVTGPGALRFYWKVSSESGWDYLRFSIDGGEQSAISGATSWALKEYDLDEGEHTLRWVYEKDSSMSSNSDVGWVDQVVWSGAGGSGDGENSGILEYMPIILSAAKSRQTE